MQKEPIQIEEKKTPLIGAPTQEQLDEWNKKFAAKWFSITNDTHTAHFRNPDRKVMNFAMSQLNQDTPLDYFYNIMKESFIGGSDLIMEDDDMFIGATQVLKEKIEGKKAELVKR